MRKSPVIVRPSFILSNIRSIKNKFEELSTVVLTHNQDINVFVETWLTNDVVDESIYIPGYTIFRKDRSYKKGGGIIIYLRNTLKVIESVEWSIPHTESVIVKLTDVKTILICIYHPHWKEPVKHVGAVNELINFLSSFILKNPAYSIALCGDFNGLSDFCQPICDSFNLINIVNFSTRKDKMLDNFITNITCLKAKKCAPIAKSDHCSILITADNKLKIKPRVTRVRRPDFSPHNRKCFEQLIGELNLNFCSDDINQDWSDFIAAIKAIYDYCFPQLTISVYYNPKCPWINDDIRMLIRKRDIEYRKTNKNMYRHYKNKVKYELKKAKQKYFAKIVKLQTKYQWNTVKSYANCKKIRTDMHISDDELNSYFNSVFIDDDYTIHGPIDTSKIKGIVVEDYEVLDLLKSLKKNGGYPFIHSSILRSFSDYLYQPLTELINRSFLCWTFPESLKKNVITPVPKINHPSSVNDYRPVTASSPFSKIIEKIVQKYWLEPVFLENEHKFNDQFAFIPLKGRGCQSALTFLYTKITQLLDKNFLVCTILIDLSKAFDRATSSKIISALSTLNTPFNAIAWISSFLSNRQHKVGSSCFLKAKSGTPQGSIISPLLFAALMSTLKPLHIRNCSYVKYADDLSMVVWHQDLSTLQKLCQEEINNVIKWCSHNQMKINSEKTKALFHQSRRSHPTPVLFIDNNQIIFAQESKILGMYLSANLKWNKQVDYCIGRASKNLFRLCLLRRACCSRTVLCQFYEYFIRNILIYSFPAICNMPKYLLKKLVRFEKHCTYLMGCAPSKSFVDITLIMCEKLKENIISIENHPFQQLLIHSTQRTRHPVFKAPGGSTSLYTQSFTKFFR